MTAQDRPSLGITLRLLSGVQMAGMFICVKAVSDDVPLDEIVFFRSFFALILAGLAVSFLFAAITTYLIFAGDSRAAHTVIFWMLGGLGLARWETFPLVCSGLLLILSYTLLRNRWLDALLTAATLGVPVKRLRFSMFVAAALATAVFVSVAGVIGFVGLMVPPYRTWSCRAVAQTFDSNRSTCRGMFADRVGHSQQALTCTPRATRRDCDHVHWVGLCFSVALQNDWLAIGLRFFRVRL